MYPEQRKAAPDCADALTGRRKETLPADGVEGLLLVPASLRLGVGASIKIPGI